MRSSWLFVVYSEQSEESLYPAIHPRGCAGGDVYDDRFPSLPLGINSLPPNFFKVTLIYTVYLYGRPCR